MLNDLDSITERFLDSATKAFIKNYVQKITEQSFQDALNETGLFTDIVNLSRSLTRVISHIIGIEIMIKEFLKEKLSDDNIDFISSFKGSSFDDFIQATRERYFKG